MNERNFPLMSQSSKYSYADKISRPFSGLLPFQKRLVSCPPPLPEGGKVTFPPPPLPSISKLA